jgi:hypothetical protein
MRAVTLLVAVVVSLVLAGSAAPAPPVVDGVDSEWNFLVARILPNGSEKVLGVFEYSEEEGTQQFIRDAAQEAARQNRTNNPAWQIVIYCPTNDPDPWYSAGDICWVSWGSQ